MRSPAYYLTNCFDAPDISLDELAAFSTDHLGRLGAHNESGATLGVSATLGVRQK